MPQVKTSVPSATLMLQLLSASLPTAFTGGLSTRSGVCSPVPWRKISPWYRLITAVSVGVVGPVTGKVNPDERTASVVSPEVWFDGRGQRPIDCRCEGVYRAPPAADATAVTANVATQVDIGIEEL